MLMNLPFFFCPVSFASRIRKKLSTVQSCRLCPNTHLYMAVQYTLNHYTYFSLIISILFITGKHLICQKKKSLFDAVILIRKPTNKIPWKCYAAGKAGTAATMNSHFRPTQVIISKVRSYKTTSSLQTHRYVSGLFMSQPHTTHPSARHLRTFNRWRNVLATTYRSQLIGPIS